jgi:hypothetical protein
MFHLRFWACAATGIKDAKARDKADKSKWRLGDFMGLPSIKWLQWGLTVDQGNGLCGRGDQAHARSSMRQADHSSLNHLTSSKNLFGLVKKDIDKQPLGACAMWVLPPGLHTKLPAVAGACSSSKLPSKM